MKAFDCTGLWWLPTSPSEKVAGTLHFAPDSKIELSLVGTLGKLDSGTAHKEARIILGIVYDCPFGSEITLKDCWVTRRHFSTNGLMREEYFVNRIFAGAHLETDERFQFDRVEIELSGLPNWASSLTGLNEGTLASEDADRGTTIGWKMPEPIVGNIPGGTLTLAAVATASYTHRKSTIAESVQFEIHFSQPRWDDDLHAKFVGPLQNLLTLATDHPNAIVDLRIKHTTRISPIHVLGARIFWDEKTAADLLPHQMLFTLEDVRDRLAQIVGRWIDLSTELAGVVNPFFAVQYKPDIFVDIKLLTAIQCLEVYGKANRTAGMTMIGNELRQTLRKLLHDHRETMSPLFGSEVEPAIERLMKFRNFIVHHDSDLANSSTYGRELYWLTQRVMFLVKACLLTELGVSAKEQLQLFKRNQIYAHLLSGAEN